MKNKNILVLPLFLSLLLSSCNTNHNTQEDKSEEETNTQESEVISESEEEKTPKLPLNPLTPVYSYSFPGLEKGVMPISAWCAPWHVDNKNNITLEKYKTIKDAGLNTIYGLYERMGVNDSYVFNALDICEQLGLSYLVRDESIPARSEDEEDLISYVEKFTSYNSFTGFLVKDEPGQSSFASLVTGRKAMRRYFTKYCYYINTFPMYASGKQFSGKEDVEITYDEYVTSFLDTIAPQMFSYDFYGISGDYPNISEGYFEQIYAAKQYADAHKVPFWPFLQACKYYSRSRVPTEAEIYWQVGANLVFGAKALQYFCYMCPYEEPSWGGNFLDFDGNKTEIYPYFKNINEYVAKIDEILMKSTLVDMMQFNDSPVNIPEGLNIVTSSREISNVETKSNIMIGIFNHDGKSAAYVFNNDTINNASLKINFASKVDVDIYEFDANSHQVGIDELELSLAPGASALVDLTNY